MNHDLENAEDSIANFIDEIVSLEASRIVDPDDVDEVIYYVRKIIHTLGLNIDLDEYNDEYLDAAE